MHPGELLVLFGPPAVGKMTVGRGRVPAARHRGGGVLAEFPHLRLDTTLLSPADAAVRILAN